MANSRIFNGSSYISCGNITALNGASTASIIGWWYMPNGTNEFIGITKGTSASTPYRTLIERWTDGVFYMGANKNSATAAYSYDKMRGWRHVAYCFNAGDQILYIDGHDGSGIGGRGSCTFTDQAGTTLANVSDQLVIGGDTINISAYKNTNGTGHCHMQVFSQCLSQAQVQALMRDPYVYPYAPVAHWPMTDDAAGTNEPDVSGNGWHGTWTGTKTFSNLSPFPSKLAMAY